MGQLQSTSPFGLLHSNRAMSGKLLHLVIALATINVCLAIRGVNDVVPESEEYDLMEGGKGGLGFVDTGSNDMMDYYVGKGRGKGGGRGGGKEGVGFGDTGSNDMMDYYGGKGRGKGGGKGGGKEGVDTVSNDMMD